ncbi:MAG: hypothetical protein A2889_09510 [Nitrospinae bacterium RIFCSPLOWO2_01_FULL_39_10]|nr:MAG: hypothetical protein A2889_09510 [Nitrospinae bacterium RIFCSPLOWO2_01_FULL_39_10]
MRSHSKFNIAANQLESAIGLFVSDRDKFSAITLAGAADTIFNQLLLNQGKENFTDHSRKKEAEKTGILLTRGEHGKEINDVLRINALKHMDNNDDDYVEMDLDECALAAILKAVANYIDLAGREVDFIKAFLYWVKLNVDPEKFQNDESQELT